MTMKIATHNGPFHGDDVMAVAALLALHPEAQIVRTRSPEALAGCDIVVDVGGVHDPERGRFDHHQKGGAGARPNGVKYSSFGLVWAQLGAQICGDPEVARIVDEEIVQAVDALDNGQGEGDVLPGVSHATLSNVLSGFNPPWNTQQDFDSAFAEAVDFATGVIRRAIRSANGKVAARGVLARAVAEATSNGRIVVLERFAPIMEGLVDASPSALFLIFPQGDDWLVQCVPVAGQAFSQRQSLPSEWAGLRGGDLAAVTGVQDAVFCHNGRFIGGAKSLAGALALAKLALP
jgi:uncharacterized UPF0160 family protein